eukprot:1158981-Pelagomonas_calceolata.AAC.9
MEMRHLQETGEGGGEGGDLSHTPGYPKSYLHLGIRDLHLGLSKKRSAIPVTTEEIKLVMQHVLEDNLFFVLQVEIRQFGH